MTLFYSPGPSFAKENSFAQPNRPQTCASQGPITSRFLRAARLCLAFSALVMTAPQLLASILAVQISKVTEETGVDPSMGDGSGIMEVRNGTVDDWRVPFVSGRNHTVTIWGDLVDLCDYVEFRNQASGAVAAIRGNALKRSAEPLWNRSRVGKLEFTLPGAIIPGSGTKFDLRVRHGLAGLFGTDTLSCRGIRRLVIDRVAWVGPATLPAVTPLGLGEASTLLPGTAHTLSLHTSAGLGFINTAAVKIGYGWQPRLVLRSPVTGFAVSAVDANFLTVTLRPDASQQGQTFLSGWKEIKLTDAAQPGTHEWGEYIFHRFRAPLPTAGTNTDLARVTVAASAGGGAGGTGGSPCPNGRVNVPLPMPEPTAAMLATAPTLVEPTAGAVGVGTVSANGTGVVGVTLRWNSFDDFAVAGFSRTFPMAEHYEVVVTAAALPPGFAFTQTLAGFRSQLSACSQGQWTGDPEPGRAWWLGVVGGTRDTAEPVMQFVLPNLKPGTTYNWSVRAVNRPGANLCGVDLAQDESTQCRNVLLGQPMPEELVSPFAIGTFTTAGKP